MVIVFAIVCKNVKSFTLCTSICYQLSFPIKPQLNLTMFGQTAANQQNLRVGNGRVMRAARRANGGSTKITRDLWQTVPNQVYVVPERNPSWEPGMGIYCSFCDTTYGCGANHWQDSKYGCRSVLACEKLQHGLHVLTLLHGAPRRVLNMEACTALNSVPGFSLDMIHDQEVSWLPNEPVFGYDHAGAWRSTGFVITDYLDGQAAFMAGNNVTPIPAHSMDAPLPQDNNQELNNERKLNGNSVFSPERITQRRTQSENALRKQIYNQVAATVVPYVNSATHMEYLILNIAHEVGNAKAALAAMQQTLAAGGQVTPAMVNGVIDCFANAGANTYVAPLPNFTPWAYQPQVTQVNQLNPSPIRAAAITNCMNYVNWLLANPNA